MQGKIKPKLAKNKVRPSPRQGEEVQGQSRARKDKDMARSEEAKAVLRPS
jgi:hypothetical protein